MPPIRRLGPSCCAIALALALALVGCNTPPPPEPEISVFVYHPASFAEGQRVFVERHDKDGREIDVDIARELGRLGFEATSGPPEERPDGIDLLIRYRDGWMWDLSMYLLDLELDFIAPDGTVLASGKSRRVSLIRADAMQMTREIFLAVDQADRAKREEAAADAVADPAPPPGSD